ncbi:C1QL [Mytilus coruscus]|uniref:C1QL n=1 Tax=Mytilus coruscus TaxID=42192 RepID=A0A6J8E3Q4_MYTCO|nr:C1QL [Mytilus coruscus]
MFWEIPRQRRSTWISLYNYTEATNVISQVGFTAVLTKDIKLGTLQTIHYDKVITNIGNGYDVSHGHFKAPVNGLYIISATSCSSENERIWTEIVINGIKQAAMYGNTNDMGRHTIVVSLKQNDQVWFRDVTSQISDNHTTSGNLLNQDSGVGEILIMSATQSDSIGHSSEVLDEVTRLSSLMDRLTNRVDNLEIENQRLNVENKDLKTTTIKLETLNRVFIQERKDTKVSVESKLEVEAVEVKRLSSLMEYVTNKLEHLENEKKIVWRMKIQI